MNKDNQILNNTIKINVGAGGKFFDGWISLEKSELDITSKNNWKSLFKFNTIQNILMEHVAEHLYYDDFLDFLIIVKPFLKKGAIIRVAVPDGNHPSEYVKELTGINGTEPGGDDHKYFYKINDMQEISKKTFYKMVPIEYFTADGCFISNNPTFENGYISRCSKNYKGRFTSSEEEYMKMINTCPENTRKQFSHLNISYTSLWVDFIHE